MTLPFEIEAQSISCINEPFENQLELLNYVITAHSHNVQCVGFTT